MEKDIEKVLTEMQVFSRMVVCCVRLIILSILQNRYAQDSRLHGDQQPRAVH